MKNIPTDLIEDGDCLSAPIIGKNGENILHAHTKLKREYIPLLKDLGVEEVCVFGNEDKKNSYIYYVEELKKIFESYIHNQKNDLYELKALAHEMYIEMIHYDLADFKKEYSMNIYHHSVLTSIMSMQFAKCKKFEDNEIEEIILAGLIHDFGIRYITVPYMNIEIDTLLPDDIFEYKKHTIYAFSALKDVEWISPEVKKMVLSHHEHMDGSGFPLKQKITDLKQNILQLSDAYISHISGMGCIPCSNAEAWEKIKEKSGIWFDKNLVAILERIIA